MNGAAIIGGTAGVALQNGDWFRQGSHQAQTATLVLDLTAGDYIEQFMKDNDFKDGDTIKVEGFADEYEIKIIQQGNFIHLYNINEKNQNYLLSLEL